MRIDLTIGQVPGVDFAEKVTALLRLLTVLAAVGLAEEVNLYGVCGMQARGERVPSLNQVYICATNLMSEQLVRYRSK